MRTPFIPIFDYLKNIEICYWCEKYYRKKCSALFLGFSGKFSLLGCDCIYELPAGFHVFGSFLRNTSSIIS